jgi:HK97 family phage portal protein
MGIISGMIESRASLENPNVSLSDPDALAKIFGDAFISASGVNVTTDKAFGVTAIWSAVNFIASTMAALPLQLFRDISDGNSEVLKSDPLYNIVHDVVNEDRLTSYKWRKMKMTSVLSDGRGYTYIERNRGMRVKNLWPLDPSTVTPKKEDNRTFYEVRDGRSIKTYEAGEIIDIPFLMMPDGLSHRAPIKTLKNAIGLAIALEEYASRFFQNGGVPPLALKGPPASPGAVGRATAAMDDAVKQAQQQNRNVLYMPLGHELAPIGFNPENAQLTESRKFQLLEIARIYSLPPTFLQDLEFGTFSNTEQQDLQLVKHTLSQWLKCWEQEMNAKLFPIGSRGRFVEFNVDGLLRGDFKTRMDGLAQGVQNALLTPNEARAKFNGAPLLGGDQGFINSASVPIAGIGAAAGDTGDGDDE